MNRFEMFIADVFMNVMIKGWKFWALLSIYFILRDSGVILKWYLRSVYGI